MKDQPAAAKRGDHIVATDIHLVLVQGSPTPLMHPFKAELKTNLSANVYFEGSEAATVGSSGKNDPPHLPTAPGTAFQNRPDNVGEITSGSETVLINDKPAARAGDLARTCADPTPNFKASVQVGSPASVLIG